MNVFKYFCHQMPERTFKIKGHYLPVCARCTGFYISIFTYIILAIFIPITYSINSIVLGILFLIPAGVDGTTQFFGLRNSNNILRFITGLIGGLGLIIIVKTFKFMFIY